MVVVFSYKTITQHLPPLGATASVEFLSLTDLTFSSDFFYSHAQKYDTNKSSSSQLCSDHTKTEQK